MTNMLYEQWNDSVWRWHKCLVKLKVDCCATRYAAFLIFNKNEIVRRLRHRHRDERSTEIIALRYAIDLAEALDFLRENVISDENCSDANINLKEDENEEMGKWKNFIPFAFGKCVQNVWCWWVHAIDVARCTPLIPIISFHTAKLWKFVELLHESRCGTNSTGKLVWRVCLLSNKAVILTLLSFVSTCQ